MNWDALPIDETRGEIKNEKNPNKAFQNIIDFGRQRLPSKIWDEFEGINLGRDIQETQLWLEQNLAESPNFKGIYFGLDTLNMEEGNGTNLEIGLSISCDPNILDDEWAFDCEHYGQSHLIKGLFDVADCFDNSEKWTNEERSFSEYLIFLGYSGIVLREALRNVQIAQDFLSVWGFHDGDLFFLIQKTGNSQSVISDS